MTALAGTTLSPGAAQLADWLTRVTAEDAEAFIDDLFMLLQPDYHALVGTCAPALRRAVAPGDGPLHTKLMLRAIKLDTTDFSAPDFRAAALLSVCTPESLAPRLRLVQGFTLACKGGFAQLAEALALSGCLTDEELAAGADAVNPHFAPLGHWLRAVAAARAAQTALTANASASLPPL